MNRQAGLCNSAAQICNRQVPWCLEADPHSLRTLKDRHHSVAMDMIDREVDTVALLLFQDRGVGTLMDMGTLGVVGLSRLEHNLLKETRCFPQVDEVPEPLQAV